MLTCEWPTPDHPEWVPFLVSQADTLRSAGVDIDVFSFRGAKNPLNYLYAWIRVRLLLRQKHYDLVHAQFGQSALLALPKVLPLVVTFHGSDLLGDTDPWGNYTAAGRLLALLSRLVSRRADAVIVVASALAQRLPPGVDYHVVPCGIDLELFRPMDKLVARFALGLPPAKNVVLFGGRPEMPVKRYGLALAALSYLRASEVQLVTASGIPHAKMPLYMNAADVLLLTSRHEGSPMVVKEALACNLPVVSTNVGDVMELIGAVDGCAVCADDRPETIAAELKRVLLYARRIRARDVVLGLEQRVTADRIIGIYQDVLARHRRVHERALAR